MVTVEKIRLVNGDKTGHILRSAKIKEFNSSKEFSLWRKSLVEWMNLRYNKQFILICNFTEL